MAKKRKRRRHSKRWYIGMRNRVIFALVCITLILLLVLGISKGLKALQTRMEEVSKQHAATTQETETEEQAPDYLRNYDSAQIDQFLVYGTHLRIMGSINSDSSMKSIFLYIVPGDADGPSGYWDRYLLTTEATTNEDGTYTYSYTTSELINEGISLETLAEGEYYLMLGTTTNSGEENFYSLKYTGDEDDITYYTVTNADTQTNNKVVLSQVQDYYNMKVAQTELPEDVYDVVIDAGHGGTDSGAVHGDYKESEIVLDVAICVKQKLEDAGYKVLLTRDGSESEEAPMAYTMYDEDGRVNVACGSDAKYAISIHLNSNEYVTTGGVQIYCSVRGNDSFAKRLADSIVDETGTTYSSMETGCIEEGVYTYSYNQEELEEASQRAIDGDYDPYDITEDTDVLFMIRELGGISTNAFIDGRNSLYGTNLYYDSNKGVECCLTELGFLSVSEDRSRILGNETGYAQGLVDGIIEQIQAAQTEDHLVTQ